MRRKNKRGRPEKSPAEELAEWNQQLRHLTIVVGTDWFMENIQRFSTRNGREELKEYLKDIRDDSWEAKRNLTETKPTNEAHKCHSRWVAQIAGQKGEEANAIELLVEAFEHKLPERAAMCLLDVILGVAETVKSKYGDKWRTQMLKKLPEVDLSKHVGLNPDGIFMLPPTPKSSSKKYGALTFDKAISEWVKQHSGVELSRRTIFRSIKQHSLSANK